MGITNFYSYVYSNKDVQTFDELSEMVVLSDLASIQKAFKVYLQENTPPFEIKEELEEEKFYLSPEEGKNGDETYLRYEAVVPGVSEKIEQEEIQEYLEEFLTQIGCQKGTKNDYEVELWTKDDARGGLDLYINIVVKGPQLNNESEETSEEA